MMDDTIGYDKSAASLSEVNTPTSLQERYTTGLRAFCKLLYPGVCMINELYQI